jgi:hypothetical protein
MLENPATADGQAVDLALPLPPDWPPYLAYAFGRDPPANYREIDPECTAVIEQLERSSINVLEANPYLPYPLLGEASRSPPDAEELESSSDNVLEATPSRPFSVRHPASTTKAQEISACVTFVLGVVNA